MLENHLRSLDDIGGFRRSKAETTKYINARLVSLFDANSPRNVPECLFLSGPSGVGKKYFSQVLTASLPKGFRIIDLNAAKIPLLADPIIDTLTLYQATSDQSPCNSMIGTFLQIQNQLLQVHKDNLRKNEKNALCLLIRNIEEIRNDQIGQFSLRQLFITLLIHHATSWARKNLPCQVLIIGTPIISPFLRQSPCIHTVDLSYESSLDYSARQEVLRIILKKLGTVSMPDSLQSTLLTQFERFSASDIFSFIQKAILYHLQAISSSETTSAVTKGVIQLTGEDFEKCFQLFSPVSQRNVFGTMDSKEDWKRQSIVKDFPIIEKNEIVKGLQCLVGEDSEVMQYLANTIEDSSILGILLHGPAGSGKSHMARALAQEKNFNLLSISASQFSSARVGDTEKNIRKFFHDTVANAPCIALVEDIDLICCRNVESCRPFVQRSALGILQGLDMLYAKRREDNARVFFLATCVNRENVDPRLLLSYRLPLAFQVGSKWEDCEEKKVAIAQMLKLYWTGRGYERVSAEQLTDLVSIMSSNKVYSSPSQIVNVLREAAMLSLSDAIERSREVAGKSNEVFIQYDHMKKMFRV